ncbi:SubName: Full=Uncharacterized protein {ECO:0000313/EMBL:CCA71276.1} [Serendipita indica DSM 11827]|nr:SubName: Full=Uncharacterized protein {ECO:0000313/EMBL:CCA71276.1} [Serendipita indica DSM 11827]
MPRIVALPVECWDQILQHAIYVPLFFDTNPLENYPASVYYRYHDQGPYWESERTRNALRRVCSCWNQILKRFDHRYVEIAHVASGGAPPDALRRAIRINATTCECKICIEALPSHLSLSVWQHELVLAADNAGEGAWKMQILDYERMPYHGAAILGRPLRFHNLKVIMGYDVPLASLNFARIKYSIKPPMLTSIDATTFEWDGPADYLQNTSFPYIRHLSIHTVTNTRSFLEWLKTTDGRLVSLFLGGEVISDNFLAELWELCPRVRHLRLPCGVKWLPLPQGRTLDLVQLSARPPHLRELPRHQCALFVVTFTRLKLSNFVTASRDLDWRKSGPLLFWTIG